MLRRYVETELGRVRDCPQAAMLSDRVFERLDESFTRTAEFVAGDTATHLVAEVLADENPIAASFPDLITKEERSRVLEDIRRRLDEGTMSLPETLVERLTEQLGSVASAFAEALERLEARRDEICEGLIPFAWYGSSHPSSGLKHQLRRVAGWIGARIEDVGVGHMSAVPGSGVRNRDSQKKMIWFLKLAGI